MATTSTGILEKSIAVLPFENLSRDPDNAYFATGIQDEILTRLAKIGALKVISRTSTQQYAARPGNLSEIARQLGVAHILEGSVQKAGDQVHINAQLIRATTEEHLWAESYDRKLENIFGVEAEVATAVADALKAKLTGTEQQTLEQKPTNNSDAYLLYLQARELISRPHFSSEAAFKTEQLLKDAIKLDPKFAVAFAELARVDDLIYHFLDPVPARKEKAWAAATEALRLQPDLPWGHLALGYYFYYIDFNYERALAEFAIAQSSLPNSADICEAIGAIERRQGKWAESIANFEKAAALNPRDASLLNELAATYWSLRNYEDVDKTLVRALEAAPQSSGLRRDKAWLALEWKGDFEPIEKELDKDRLEADPDGFIMSTRVNLLFLQRKFPQALTILQQRPEEVFKSAYGTLLPKKFLEGFAYLNMKDEAKARVAFDNARRTVERSVRETPNEVSLSDAYRHALLGKILAFLGQKEAAVAEGKRAIEILPESKDAFDGPDITLALAQIYAWTGEQNLALQLLEHSFSTPAGISARFLQLDPVWDPLRDDPRFQKLCEEKQH